MKKIQILGTGCPKCKKLYECAEQAAKELDVSISTVERTWAFARAWLHREIRRIENPS